VSKRKLFNLIKEGAVHVAPKNKILPAKEYSSLLNASEVLEYVQKDAEMYKMDVVKEIEKLKIQAQREGFEEGFRSWAEAVALLESEIAQVRADVEKMLSSVALKAAKKIVGREIELSDDTIIDIIGTSLKSVAQHKKITIYANKKDLAILEANRGRLKDLFEGLESLSLRERADIDTGGCIIETEGGIINARLENQWRVLEKAFENLLKPKAPL
jgi:type III secretion protein L